MSVRANGRGGWRATAPAQPGLYVVEVTSLRTPALAPAQVRFRVMDPERVRAMALRLVFPRGRDQPPRRFALVLEDHQGMHVTARVARRQGEFRAEVALEPGAYRLQALGRRAHLSLSGPEHRVVFDGSRVLVELDGLPSDWVMFEIRARFAEGSTARIPLHHTGALLGDDVPPGPIHLEIRSVPRTDAWDPDDPNLAWRTLRALDLDVPPASETTWTWSTPALLAGEDPAPRAWAALPGAGMLRPGSTPAEAVTLLAQPGFAVAFGAHIHEHAGGRWRAWVDQSSSLWPIVPSAPSAVGAVLLRFRAYAWIDGGRFVFFRNPRGIAREYLPTLRRDLPYPCTSTGITASARELVVVGRCRGNAPESSDVPHDGYVAVRTANRWRVQRGVGPLRAVASRGGRAVAVGDRGQVAVRQAGQWSFHRAGDADFVDVAIGGRHIVARTAEGALVEFGAMTTPPSPFYTPPARHPVEDHCFVGERAVIWLRARSYPSEGGPYPSEVPDVVLVRDLDGSSRVIFRSDEARVDALACGGSGAWILVVGEDDAQRLTQLRL